MKRFLVPLLLLLGACATTHPLPPPTGIYSSFIYNMNTAVAGVQSHFYGLLALGVLGTAGGAVATYYVPAIGRIVLYFFAGVLIIALGGIFLAPVFPVVVIVVAAAAMGLGGYELYLKLKKPSSTTSTSSTTAPVPLTPVFTSTTS